MNFFTLAIAVAVTFAQLHTPGLGSKERKAIMDALRAPTQKDIGQKVIFKVGYLKVDNGWALAMAEPIQPNSQPINWKKTKYKDAVENDTFGFTVIAILKQSGSGWKVMGYDLGATDLGPVETFQKKFREAPRSIFPKISGLLLLQNDSGAFSF